MSFDFASTRTATAHKVHRCGECYRVINPGETYQRAAGKWEGDFWSMKTCAHCVAFRLVIREFDPDYYESYYGGIDSWCSDGASDDILMDHHIPWERRLALFRIRHHARHGWRGSDGELLSVPHIEEAQ